MSKSIEDRLVSMSFDNQNFEKNISKSMDSLNALDKVISNTASNKSFINLEKTINNVDFSGISDAIESIGSKFNFLSVAAASAINTIVSRATNAGIRIAESLSVDQIRSGWSKYADKTTSVQTIMGAVEDAEVPEEYESKMEYVTSMMEKLNWFTDETSYNFVDMVNNIGKFTSAGESLDTSVAAMEGIATWAAVSGQNASTASRAMYNLSQALSSGSVRLQDWMSIENANMATKEFKELAIESALVVGTLKKDAQGVYSLNEAGKKTYVTYKNFRETLSDKWFDKNTLTTTLSSYSSFAESLNVIYDELNSNLDETAGEYTTSQIIDDVLAMKKVADETGQTFKEVAESNADYAKYTSLSLDDLMENVTEIGIKAFKASQEAKTLEEAIDSVKDAASTGWMNIFETIFGNYEEAKVLWTSLANSLYDYFISPLNSVQTVLSAWKDVFGGREVLFGGDDSPIEFSGNLAYLADVLDEDGNRIRYFRGIFVELVDTISSWVAPIKKAWNDVFPQKTVGELALGLKNITISINDFIIGLRSTSSSSSAIEKIFHNVFTVLKSIGSAFASVVKSARPLIFAFKSVGNVILEVTSRLTDAVAKLFTSDKFTSIVDKFSKIIYAVSARIKYYASTIELSIGSLIDAMIPKITAFFDSIASGWSWLDAKLKIQETFTSVYNYVRGLFDKTDKETETFAQKMDRLFEKLTTLKNNLKNAFKTKIIDENGEEQLTFLGRILDTLGNVATSVKNVFKEFFGTFFKGLAGMEASDLIKLLVSGQFLNMIANAFGPSGKTLSNITEIFASWSWSFEDIFYTIYDHVREFSLKTSALIENTMNVENFKKLATGLLIMAAAVLVLSSIPADRLATSVAAIGVLAKILSDAMNQFAVIANKAKYVNKATGIFSTLSSTADTSRMILSLAGAIAILAVSMKVLSTIKPADLITSGVALMVIVKALTIAMQDLSSIKKGSQVKGLLSLAAALMVMAVSIKILASVQSGGWAAVGMLSALIAVLGLFVYMAKKNSGSMAFVGASMIGIAIAVSMLVGVLYLLDNVPMKNLETGMLVLAALLGTMLLLGKAVDTKSAANLLLFSTAIGSMTIALAGMFTVLALVASFKIGTLVKMFAVLAVSLVTLAVVLLLLSKVKGGVTTLLQLSGAIALFGVALLAVSAGILALSTAAGSLVLVFTGLIGSLPVMMEFIKLFLISLLTMIPEIIAATGDSIISSIELLLTSVLKAFVGIWPLVLDTLKVLLVDTLQFLTENLPTILDCLFQIFTGILDWSITMIPKVLETLWQWITAMGSFLLSKIPEIIDFIFTFVLTLIDNITIAIGEYTPRLVGSVLDMMGAIVKAIAETIAEVPGRAVEWGGDIINGLIKGLGGFVNNIKDTIKTVGTTIKDEFCRIFGIHSPSRVFAEYGMYMDQGLANGLEKYSGVATNAVEDLGDGIADSMQEALSKAVEAAQNGTDCYPTITPVLDLTNVEDGLGTMNGMLNTNHVMSVAAKSTYDPNYHPDGSVRLTSGDLTVSAIADLRSEFDMLAEKIGNLRIVMDSGELVGAISGPMDSALGRRAIYAGRGMY